MTRRADDPPEESAARKGLSDRDKLIGLGESSISKSYYPELQARLDELVRFRALMDQSRDVFLLVEPASAVIEDVIGASRDVLGLQPGELLGRSLLDVLGSCETRQLSTALGGGSEASTLEACFLHPGTRKQVPLEMTVQVASGPGRPQAVVVARDVSERKRAEEALRKAEERYRSIFENAAEGVFQSTPEGRFLAVNPAMAEKLGYDSPEQLVSEITDIPHQLYVDPDDRDKLLRDLNLYGRVKSREMRVRRRNGEIMWVSLNMRKVFDDAGQLAWLEGSAEDVTARKQAEEQLLQAHLELEQRVQERTAELKRANERLVQEVEVRKAAQQRYKRAKDEAEKASRAKSEFLSMVSHELRTPLTSVLGFARIIQRKLVKVLLPLIPEHDAKAKKAGDQVQENLAIIVEEGLRLTSLINDVLDLSKLEAGKVELKPGPLDMEETARRAMQSTASLFDQRRVRLGLDVDRDLPLAHGDRDRVFQVLVNLLSNAAKFTEHGRVTVQARRVEDMAEVSVSDTGSGIDPDHFEDIFDKFQQIGDESDRPSGTGLGLSICRHIVRAHGGDITVSSEPGRGAVFTFTLPLADEPARKHPGPPEGSEAG
jgi:PAS domain S-box-containing protein